MQEKIDGLKARHPDLKFELVDIEIPYLVKDEVPQRDTFYVPSGLPVVEGRKLRLYDEEDFDWFADFLSRDPKIFRDYLGAVFNGVIEVPLEAITSEARMLRYRPREKLPAPININIAYNGNQLNVSLSLSASAPNIHALTKRLRAWRPRRSGHAFIQISNLNKEGVAGLEADARNVINSVLFDIEYTYGLGYELINVEPATLRRTIKRGRQLPPATLNLLYKNYIPELLEYFHIAEKVDYLPFKYICYFHVIEYFTDKSAYTAVAKKVQELILRPDFHLNTKDYINQAINLFKKENEKYTSDKTKINRVLREFIEKDVIEAHLSELELEKHFTENQTLQCSKPLEVSALLFNEEKAFYDSLTKRIYAMRCSIVHSNPDFDESKAVPFSPTPKNMEFLRKEIYLAKEIAQTIISKTCY